MYTRVEVVRDQDVIKEYVRVRTTEDKKLLKKYGLLKEAAEAVDRKKSQTEKQIFENGRKQKKLPMNPTPSVQEVSTPSIIDLTTQPPEKTVSTPATENSDPCTIVDGTTIKINTKLIKVGHFFFWFTDFVVDFLIFQ